MVQFHIIIIVIEILSEKYYKYIFCLLNADVELMNLIKKNPGKSISCYTGQKFDTCNQRQRYRLSYIKISKTLARIKCCTMTNVALIFATLLFAFGAGDSAEFFSCLYFTN